MKYNKLNNKDKDLIYSFTAAVFVSLLFYFTQRDHVWTDISFYLFYFGVLMPFGLPLYIYLKKEDV